MEKINEASSTAGNWASLSNTTVSSTSLPYECQDLFRVSPLYPMDASISFCNRLFWTIVSWKLGFFNKLAFSFLPRIPLHCLLGLYRFLIVFTGGSECGLVFCWFAWWSVGAAIFGNSGMLAGASLMARIIIGFANDYSGQ
jgi:hypothetical protein